MRQNGMPPESPPFAPPLDANDIARHLRINAASSSEDVISQLRGMNLGDSFWMFSFKVYALEKGFRQHTVSMTHPSPPPLPGGPLREELFPQVDPLPLWACR